MVGVYPYNQALPPVISTITTNLVINANSTAFIDVRQLPGYLTEILFFQGTGPTGTITIYLYQYFSHNGSVYDTIPQNISTITITSSSFYYSRVFLTPTPFIRYGISPTATITLSYVGVIYR